MLQPNGFPRPLLQLKVSTPILLLRNLDPSRGLCNGTRMVVTRLGQHGIVARIMGTEFDGEERIIPRVKLIQNDDDLGFQRSRTQLPVTICFAMTINKSQGQSVTYVGLNMKAAVFTHGQFYVAISRVRSVNNIKVIWDENQGHGVTKNVVYPEVLLN